VLQAVEKPRTALDDAGCKTVLIAPDSETVQAMNHDNKGVDVKMKDADPEKFDAVLLPGRVMNADKLRMNDDARKFVKAIDGSKKPIAVICHGPWSLVSARLVKGRHLTNYYTLQDDLRNAGAQWSEQETVVDGNWVSSRQPNDIPAFNKAILELFGKAKGKFHAAGW